MTGGGQMTGRRHRARRLAGLLVPAIVVAFAAAAASLAGVWRPHERATRQFEQATSTAPSESWSPQPHAPDLAQATRALGLSPEEHAALQRLYAPDGPVLLWFTGGALSRDGLEAVARLRTAATDGLDPAAYLAGPLGAPDAAVPAQPDRQAEYDVALSLGMLRFMRHLHLGRVDPRTLGLRLDAWAEPHDFPALLGEAIAARRVAAAVDALAPPFTVYAELIDALERYRAIAARNDPAVPPFVRAAAPGGVYPSAHALGVHLEARGDLAPADVPSPGDDRYSGALVDGVRRFQARHGLTPDGVLDARTTAAARVPALVRVRQIEMALERLRWLPDLGARRLIAVNIPMFRLWAWDRHGEAPATAFSTRVIVGAAMRTETPVFVERMDQVVFRPYWNVPRSILHNEILPAMRRNPVYLTRQQMEVVSGQGDDARALVPGPDTLTALASGTLRVRQRPGPHNALGLVKFVFPNRENVYMHGTPTPSLFARDRRDFSHGCIRLADPAGLAAWVLGGVRGWDAAQIEHAMHAEVSTPVHLAEAIDVVLFYLTAAVMPEDQAVHFADDIYGHDADLARTLYRTAAPR